MNAIFDELKTRVLENIFFISMDGISGLEDGAKTIFPNLAAQRCIVHLIRNSCKYLSYKDRKEFCKDLRTVYTESTSDKTLEALDKCKGK